MKILKFIGIGVLGLIALFLIIPLFLPSTSNVVRSTTVAVPVDSAFNYLSDFNQFKQWSPWQGIDPAMTTSIEGSGIGSKYSWKGNDEVGSGSMTMVGMEKNKYVDIKLVFISPWQSTAATKWSVEPAETGSKVSWAMSQEMPYLMRYMGLMMDGMLGKDFDKGLSNVKNKLEKK